jgi:hypothetical protein
LLTIPTGELLLFESTLAPLRPPDRRTLKAFCVQFFHEKTDPVPILGGASKSLYDDLDDLVALHDSTELD